MNDYVFFTGGIVIEIDSYPEELAQDRAKELSRLNKRAVGYAIVQKYNVEPDRCQVCGEVMPAEGPCPCQDWE